MHRKHFNDWTNWRRKTEIARRMAKVVGAPFIKVEATTEVGYVGRDVESMVRDLVDIAVRLVKEQKKALVEDEARSKANEKLVKLLVPSMKKKANSTNSNNPLESLLAEQYLILVKIMRTMMKKRQLKKSKQSVLKSNNNY